MLLKPALVAKTWNLHPKTITQWIVEKKLPAVKTLGGQYRIKQNDLAEFAKAHHLPLPQILHEKEYTLLTVGKVLRLRRSEHFPVRVFHEAHLYSGLLQLSELKPELLVIDSGLLEVDAFLTDFIQFQNKTENAKIALCIYELPSRFKAEECISNGATIALAKVDSKHLKSQVKEFYTSLMRQFI